MDLTERLWLDKPSAPKWAQILVADVWRQYGDGPVPRLIFCEGPGDGSYHGRWFPSQNGIAMWQMGDRVFEKVILLHELAHALVTLESANFSGKHTKRFYEVVTTLYNRYDADPSIVTKVEDRIKWRKADSRRERRNAKYLSDR